MPDDELFALDVNALPWEDRFNEPTGMTLHRKEIFITIHSYCHCRYYLQQYRRPFFYKVYIETSNSYKSHYFLLDK